MPCSLVLSAAFPAATWAAPSASRCESAGSVAVLSLSWPRPAASWPAPALRVFAPSRSLRCPAASSPAPFLSEDVPWCRRRRAVVERGHPAGEVPGAVGGLEHLGVDGAEAGEELVGGLLAHLLGHGGVDGGGELVHDRAEQVVVGVVGGDVQHGLVGGVEASRRDQVGGEVPGDLQRERVLAAAHALVRGLRAGDGLPVEDVAVHEAVGDLPAGLQPGAVGGAWRRCPPPRGPRRSGSACRRDPSSRTGTPRRRAAAPGSAPGWSASAAGRRSCA